jgi:hypothetical protein
MARGPKGIRGIRQTIPSGFTIGPSLDLPGPKKLRYLLRSRKLIQWTLATPGICQHVRRG